MKRPSFQFYPADWRGSANLRRCCPAARGAWMDILCVLHDSDVYGLVRWPLSELANAANVPLKHVRELVDKTVLKGCDQGQCQTFTYTPRSGRKDGPTIILVGEQNGPIWFSSRMVKDEYIRTVRGEKAPHGEDIGDALDHSPKIPFGEGIGPRTQARLPAQSSSSSASPSVSTSLRSVTREECPEPEKPKKVNKSTKTSIPDGFPSTDLFPEAEETWRAAGRSDIDPAVQAQQFRDYHLSKGSRMADWDAAWRTWYRNAIPYTKPPQLPLNGRGYPQAAKNYTSYEDDWREKVKRFRGKGIWLNPDGPQPDDPDCTCPKSILKEFGYA